MAQYGNPQDALEAYCLQKDGIEQPECWRQRINGSPNLASDRWFFGVCSLARFHIKILQDYVCNRQNVLISRAQ